MGKLYRGIHQRNESGVVCDILGQPWIRYWKQGCLVERMWFWMCGIIVVHMFHMLYMFHMWCCAHAMLCIYSVCTRFLCNDYVQGGTDSRWWIDWFQFRCWFLILFDILLLVDHSYGGMIAYVGEWHEEIPGSPESTDSQICIKCPVLQSSTTCPLSEQLPAHCSTTHSQCLFDSI